MSDAYDCSVERQLKNDAFDIINAKIPSLLYNMAGQDAMLEEFDTMISEKLVVKQKRHLSYTSFGQSFKGFLYQAEKEEKCYS